MIGGHRFVVSRRKVVFSLRSKEAKVAKERFKLVLNALGTFFESLSQPPLGRADVRALACEICKQAVHEIDHDDAVADEAEAYRDAFAEVTERHLRSSRP